jgi:hypothetical protein
VIIAYVVLFLFPVLVVILFLRMDIRWALVWTIVLGYLFLPASAEIYVDLPLLPPIDKTLVPSLMAAISAYLVLRRKEKEIPLVDRGAEYAKISKEVSVLPGFLPRSYVALICMSLLVVGVIMSVLTNRDVLVYGTTVLPAQRTYDIFSLLLWLAVSLLPMCLGRKFLFDNDGHRILLTVMATSALIYSLLALYEVRMSPQLNVMLYGFFPHSWIQHVRAGGFRPIVFLDHGLLLGIFLSCSLVAMASLARLSIGLARALYLLGIPYLLGVLFLSKTLGALVIAVSLLPVALLLPVRLQLVIAALIAGVTLSYPLMRGADIIPTEVIVDIAATNSAERAESLAYRFHHEDMLLTKAADRPVFGWGSWGRWRVYDENGRDITTSDGAWVITISRFGWLGYIAQFSFLCIPLIVFAIRQKRYEIGLATAGLCVLVAANLIDLLPNASITPLTWLAAGALLGRFEIHNAPALLSTVEKTEGSDWITNRYTRFAYHNRR